MPLRNQLRAELHAKFTYYRELHFSREKIESELVKAGINDEELLALRQFFFIQRKKQKHTSGLVLTILGSVLLITGFILTAVLYHQGSPVEGVMYGFTSAGLTLLIAGICFLF